jgi:hypothetical protein
MNTWISWALAVAALYVGYKNFGWQGIVFAISLIVFWLLMQYSRINRVMRRVANSPKGHVGDARGLALKLKKGLPLIDVLKMTDSLGLLTRQEPETYRWADDNGRSIDVVFDKGRTSVWTLDSGG